MTSVNLLGGKIIGLGSLVKGEKEKGKRKKEKGKNKR
jgi:hypothetical protein